MRELLAAEPVAGAHPFGVAGGLGVRPARPADLAPLPGARAHRAGPRRPARAARKVVAARGDQLRARLAEPVTGDGHARLDARRDDAAGGPADHAAHRARGGGGLPRARSGPPGRGARSRRASRARGAARAAAQRHHRHGPRAVGAGDAAGPGVDGRACARRRPPSWPSGTTPARCHPCCSAGWRRSSPSTATATAAEIDLGMPRWSDDPTQVLGVAGQLPAARPTRPATPTPGSPGAAAAAEAAVARGRRARCGGARGCARWVTGFALRRTRQLAGHARDAQGLPRAGARARPGPARDPRRRAGRAAVCSRPPTTSSSWSCARSRPRSTAPTSARSSPIAAPSTTGSCGAATSPGCCCPTAPSPRPSTPRPRRDGALVGHPGLGGHRHGRGPGGARPGRTPTWSRARSSSRRPPTPAGPRCSSPRAGS